MGFDIGRETRLALRGLVRNAGLATSVIATLAATLAASALAIGVVKAVSFRSLPYSEADRLFEVNASTDARCGTDCLDLMSIAEVQRVSAVSSFERTSAFVGTRSLVQYRDTAFQATAAFVDSAFFHVLAAEPVYGRFQSDGGFTEASVVLSPSIARQLFGVDSMAVGKAVRVDSVTYLVSAVVDATFGFPAGTRLWVVQSQPIEGTPTDHQFAAIGRLRAGSTMARLRQELARLDLPGFDDRSSSRNRRLAAIPIAAVRGLRGSAYRTLMLSVAIVVAMGCLTVVNLLLVRALEERKHVAVRLAMGASHPTLYLQLLVNNVTAVLIGAAAGLWLAWTGSGAVGRALSAFLRRNIDVSLDWRVVLIVLGIALLLAALLSLAPLLVFRRVDPRSVLQATDAAMSSTSGALRVRHILVAVEIAATVVLVVVASVLTTSFIRANTKEVGYDADRLYVLSLPRPVAWRDPLVRDEAVSALLSDLHRVPSVQHATVWSTSYPSLRDGPVTRIRLEDATDALPNALLPYNIYAVTPGFFAAVGLSVSGRAFTSDDKAGTERVVIVNDAAARRWWPGAAPLGKRLWLGNGEVGEWARVVGVAPTSVPIHPLGLEVASRLQEHPLMFLPARQATTSNVTVGVRLDGEPGPPLAIVDRIVRQHAGLSRLPAIVRMREILLRAPSFRQTRANATVVGSFGVIGVCLGLLGVFAVVAETTRRRKKEIGIRRALGATPAAVIAMLVRMGVVIAASGALVGLVALLLLARWLGPVAYGITAARPRGMLMDMSPNDPLVLVAAATAIVSLAALASVFAAWRSTRVTPLDALRA